MEVHPDFYPDRMYKLMRLLFGGGLNADSIYQVYNVPLTITANVPLIVIRNFFELRCNRFVLIGYAVRV